MHYVAEGMHSITGKRALNLRAVCSKRSEYTPDIDFINEVIFHELCIGKIENKSQQHFEKIIENLRTKGAEGVILGCTEIGMLIKQENSVLPVFDTTEIHAKCAVELALEMHAYK